MTLSSGLRFDKLTSGKQQLLAFLLPSVVHLYQKWEMWRLLREPRPVWGWLRCSRAGGVMLIPTLLARRASRKCVNMYFKSPFFVGPTRLFRFYNHVTLLIDFHKASSPSCHNKETACRCDVTPPPQKKTGCYSLQTSASAAPPGICLLSAHQESWLLGFGLVRANSANT